MTYLSRFVMFCKCVVTKFFCNTVGNCCLFTLTLVLTGHLKSWNDVRNLCMLLLPREPLRLELCVGKPRAYNTESRKTSRLHRRIKTNQKWVIIYPLKPIGATCSNINELRLSPTICIVFLCISAYSNSDYFHKED